MRAAAMIFDLDGVLTDTARAHYRAWRRLADELGLDFDEKKNERLKGVDRMRSLEILLEAAPRAFSAEEKAALCERKNGYYREIIADISQDDLLPGARRALTRAREAGLKTALASASRNAPFIVARLGVADLFDFIADAAFVARPKPDPEIFLLAASGLGVAPGACVGVEDSAAGVAAIKAAGMYAVGVGDSSILAQADETIAAIAALEPEKYAGLTSGGR